MRYDPHTVDKFSDLEKQIIERLPELPAIAGIRTSKICIVEWLWPGDFHSGFELHAWIESFRPGWAEYFDCPSKQAFLSSISLIARRAKAGGHFPVLHVEAHGDEEGLAGPGGSVRWDELTGALAELNEATGCNLILVVAACTGFSALLALTRGPRAPAAVIIGPAAEMSGRSLLAATQQLYSQWSTGDLRPMVERMSEVGGVLFEFEPFSLLCYESMIDFIVDRFRRAREAKNSQGIAAAVEALPDPTNLQQMWDQMFFIDTIPANRGRFGIDWKAVIDEFLAEV